MSKTSLQVVLKITDDFWDFWKFLDTFKSGFGQHLVVKLVAFETNVRQFLVLDTLKTELSGILVAL